MGGGGGGGGGVFTPSPSHNTSTGPRFLPGDTPVPDRGYPIPDWGVTPYPAGGTPSWPGWWGTPSQGWGTLQPGCVTPWTGMGYPPPPRQVALWHVMPWAVCLLQFPAGGLSCCLYIPSDFILKPLWVATKFEITSIFTCLHFLCAVTQFSPISSETIQT